MSSPLKIKAKGIHQLSDARYFSTFSEWIGLDFDPESTRNLSLEKASEIMPWLVGPTLVAEVGNLDTEVINSLCSQLKIEAIETTGLIKPENLHPIVSIWIRRVIWEDGWTDVDFRAALEESRQKANFIVLDFYNLEGGWEALQRIPNLGISELAEICESKDIILALDLEIQEAKAIVKTLNPFALELRGGDEIKVGLRSFDHLENLYEELEDFIWA